MWCDMARSCDEWWMIYCDVWDHVLVIGITTCMSMSMTTGRSHRSCLYFLYDLRVIEERHVTYFTLLLNVSHRSRSSRWRDNFMKTRWWRSWWWRSWCQAGDKMIMEPRRWRSMELYDIGHIMSQLYNCMWCLLCIMHLVYLGRR